MIVSVLGDSSAPARTVSSSSADKGLPCASVRLSRPTSRMSIAPSSPPLPSEGANMWKMPSSNDGTLFHATPVPITTATAKAVASARTTRCTGITLGYLRHTRFSGSRLRRGPRLLRACQTRSMSGRVLLTGAGGQLGSCLAAQATDQGRDLLVLNSSQWDITDPAAAERIVKSGDVVMNCAAYTNVDGAETAQAAAYSVNAAGPAHLARACARAGARLIHVSTDFVFSGDFGPEGKGVAPHPYEHM